MTNVIERVAHYADIDTRRAMGFLPRRLNVTFEIPRWTEQFFYVPNRKTLVYHETGRYGYYYTETITNIVPVSEQEHKWKLLKGARIRGVVYSETKQDEYDVAPTTPYRFYTAGWPVFTS